MTQQPRRDERNDPAPNSAADRQPAEGSRDSVEPDSGAGITNRSADREQQEQQELPPRGTRKDGSHA